MKRSVVTLLVAMACLSMSAQLLTIAQAVNMACENYPAVARYGLLERSTAFSLDNASMAWLPQGVIAAQATWQNDVAALPDMLTDMMTSRGIDYPGLSRLKCRNLPITRTLHSAVISRPIRLKLAYPFT